MSESGEDFAGWVEAWMIVALLAFCAFCGVVYFAHRYYKKHEEEEEESEEEDSTAYATDLESGLYDKKKKMHNSKPKDNSESEQSEEDIKKSNVDSESEQSEEDMKKSNMLSGYDKRLSSSKVKPDYSEVDPDHYYRKFMKTKSKYTDTYKADLECGYGPICSKKYKKVRRQRSQLKR